MFLKKMMSDKVFWKTMLSLAIPIVLQQLLSSSLAMVDNLMVGRLGDIPVAAVGQAAQAAQLINLFFIGICSGGAVFAAQYWGAKNMNGIRATYGLVMLLCGGISVIFSVLVSLFPAQVISLYTDSPAIIAEGAAYIRIAAFSYIGIALNFGLCTILRSVEQVRLPVIANAVTVLVNVFFNGVLIFGKCGFPALGVRGAAIATVISSLVNPTVILIISMIKRNILRCSVKELFRFPQGFVRRFLVMALPAFINESAWALGIAVTNMVYGRMGETNVAAMTVTNTVQNISFVAFIGLCNAAAVMIGKRIGEGKIDDVKEYAKRFLWLAPTFSLVIGLVVSVLRRPLVSCFALSHEAAATAMVLLVIYGLEMVIRTPTYIAIVGIFRPAGSTRIGMILDGTTLWLIAVPVSLVLGLVLRLDFVTVYLCTLLAEDIPKISFMLPYFFKFRWIHTITDDGKKE